MRVRGKALARRDAVVIQDAQRAEMHMLGVVIVGKRKREISIQPAVVPMAAVLAFADVYHWSTSRFDTKIILVITTIVKRHILPPRLRPVRPSGRPLRDQHPPAFTVRSYHSRRPPFGIDCSSRSHSPSLFPRIALWIPRRPQRKRESPKLPLH